MAAGDISLLMLKEDNVRAKWSHYYDRKILEELDVKIDEIWEERIKTGQKLYDATKFRLHSWSQDESGVLHLNLGLTCYKEYICTNQSLHCNEYLEKGLKRHGDRQACMADPLAVGAYLETTDKKLVFLQRSVYCAEAASAIDRPGGHPEPQELLDDPTTADLESQSSESLISEIFTSILREIRDEVNIDPMFTDPPLLLGIFRNQSTGGRPIADFYISCKLSSDQVRSLYEAGTQAEAYESTNIVFIDREEFLQGEKLPTLYEKFSPSLKTTIPLLQAFFKHSQM